MKTNYSKYFFILVASMSLLFATSCAEFGAGSSDEPEKPSESGNIKADGEVVTEGAVDLGLSVKWAACNLKASACYDNGDEYEWGDQRSDCLLDICGTKYDQATTLLGEGWQLPTYEQAKELLEKCRWTYNQYRGTQGFIVTGPSMRAIFIPYYTNLWTGTCDINSNKAYYIYLSSSCRITTSYRYQRQYIRPVYVGP